MKRASIQVAGLWTSGNPLSAPEGAMRQLSNAYVSEGGIIRARRGRDLEVTTGGGPAQKLCFFDSYPNTLLAFKSNGAIQRTVEGLGSITDTWTGNDPIPGERHSVERYGKFTFFTTAFGVKRFNNADSTPVFAGLPIPPGWNGRPTLQNAPPAGSYYSPQAFLPAQASVAYRYLIGYRFNDPNLPADGQVIYGPVSGRFTVKNTDAALDKNVSHQLLLPFQNNTTTVLDGHYFVQLYRCKTDDNLGDRLYLCAEQYVTSTDTGLGYMTILDDCLDDQLGEELYTNSNQYGERNTNFPPPIAGQLCQFKGNLFYFNCNYRYQLALSLLSTDTASGGMIDGHTITINDGSSAYTFTAKDNPTLSTHFRRFEIGSAVAASDTGSTALNLEMTAQDLCRVINNTAGIGVYAYYASGELDLERGKIMLMSKTDATAGFSVYSSAARTYWSPTVPVVASQLVSTSVGGPSYIAISRKNFPEAVPPSNMFSVGDDHKIFKAIVHNDSLWVFKYDGLWRIVGDDVGDFQVLLVDPNFRLMSPESVCVMGDQMFALGRDGLYEVKETGTRNVSLAIRDTLNQLINKSAGPDAVYAQSFIVPYHSEGLVLLWLPATASDDNMETAYVYHVKSGIWATWAMGATAGAMTPFSDKLYTAKYEAGSGDWKLFAELKNFEASDFSDDGGLGKAYTVTLEWLPQRMGSISYQKRFIRAHFMMPDQPSVTATFGTEVQAGTPFTINSLGVSLATTLIDTQRGAALSVLLEANLNEVEFELAGIDIDFYEYKGTTR